MASVVMTLGQMARMGGRGRGMAWMDVKVGLIKGRHAMPVSDYIFHDIDDVMDFKGMDSVVTRFLEETVGIDVANGRAINSHSYADDAVFVGRHRLVVYVTGLSAALAALVAGCARNGVRLTIMHWDNKSGEYVPQEVL